MRRGWRTTEFWLAFLWSAFAIGFVGGLANCPPALWPTALVAMPAVCLFVWFSGIAAHNYAENRFQLKAQRGALLLKQEQEGQERGKSDDPGRTFIFGAHVASESEEQGEEGETS